MDITKKEGVDPAESAEEQNPGLDKFLEDLDREMDILEEEQKKRWGTDGKPEEYNVNNFTKNN